MTTAARPDDATRAGGRLAALTAAVGGEASLRAAVLAWLVSRLAFIGTAVVLEIVGAVRDPGPFGYPGLSTVPVLRDLIAWDGTYYLGIAAGGYHLGAVVGGRWPDAVFFPLLPALTLGVAPFVDGSIAIAALLVSNLATLAALLGIAALGTRRGVSPDAVSRASWLIAFSPVGVALAMVYTDSLQLALLAAAFLAADRRRPGWAGVALGIAALARPTGILFVAPLALAIDRALGPGRSGGARVGALAPLLLAPAAIAGFSLFQGLALGDPLAWVHGQSAWAGQDLRSVLLRPELWPLAVILVYPLLAYAAAIPAYLRSRHRDDGLLPTGVAAILLTGRALSAARYLVPAWSVAWAVAEAPAPRRRWLTTLWVSTSLVYGALVLSWTVGP